MRMFVASLFLPSLLVSSPIQFGKNQITASPKGTAGQIRVLEQLECGARVVSATAIRVKTACNLVTGAYTYQDIHKNNHQVSFGMSRRGKKSFATIVMAPTAY